MILCDFIRILSILGFCNGFESLKKSKVAKSWLLRF